MLTRRPRFLGYLGAFVFLTGFVIGLTVQLTAEVRVREIEMRPQAAVPVCNTSHAMMRGREPGLA